MSRVILDCAAFLDAPVAAPLVARGRAGVQQLVERLLRCCYEDLGKAPRHLDGDDVAQILTELLPARLARRDPLAARAEEVLVAYFEFLETAVVVAQAYEIRRALEGGMAAFAAAVESGALANTRAPAQTTVVHRAERVGRNDPCPCGSGKKFKKCCARLGG